MTHPFRSVDPLRIARPRTHISSAAATFSAQRSTSRPASNSPQSSRPTSSSRSSPTATDKALRHRPNPKLSPRPTRNPPSNPQRQAVHLSRKNRSVLSSRRFFHSTQPTQSCCSGPPPQPAVAVAALPDHAAAWPVCLPAHSTQRCSAWPANALQHCPSAR
jgi:hypothetical protein